MRRWFTALVLLLPLVLSSGCATQVLWTSPTFAHTVKPAAKPNLRLYAAISRPDFLVVYDENGHHKHNDRTRAYFLNQNLQSIRLERAPHFVDADLAFGLPPVPVFCSPFLGTNQPSRPFAVSDGKTQTFTIYFREGGQNFYHLPIYKDNAVTFSRVALTPLAVTADAIMLYVCVAMSQPSMPSLR